MVLHGAHREREKHSEREPGRHRGHANRGLRNPIQRSHAHGPAALQRQEGAPSSDLLHSLWGKSQRIQQDFEALYDLINEYSKSCADIGGSVREDLAVQASQYGVAYRQFSSVVGAGRAEAQNQEFWTNIALGIPIGVGVGLYAAWALPTEAAGWGTVALGELAGIIGSSAGQSLTGGLLSAGLSELVSPAGTNLQPSGLPPEFVQTKVWQTAARIYRDGLAHTALASKVHDASVLSQALIGEIRVHLAGGETVIGLSDIKRLVKNLDSSRRKLMGGIRHHIRWKLSMLRKLEKATESMKSYTSEDMEKDIWILWIAGLDDPSVLDLDEIEDYLHGKIGILGRRSLLGVDFGLLTTDEDVQEAHRAAVAKAAPIQKRIKDLGTSEAAMGRAGEPI
jgi:hypothetical protein